jgi:hypothetical protein
MIRAVHLQNQAQCLDIQRPLRHWISKDIEDESGIHYYAAKSIERISAESLRSSEPTASKIRDSQFAIKPSFDGLAGIRPGKD